VNPALEPLVRGEQVDWNSIGIPIARIVELCEGEEVAGIVLDQINAKPKLLYPQHFYFELHRVVHQNAPAEILRWEQQRLAIDALEINGVQPILFKGAALRHMVYRDLATRPSSDTDLMIRREDVERVRKALAPLEYQETNYSGGEELFHQFEMQKTDGWGVCHAFDFHWKISTQTLFADLLTYEEMERESVTLSRISSMARGAGLLHSLLIACTHPVMHHRNEERLVWLYDIHLLSQRLSETEWQRFERMALAKQVGAVCGHVLATAHARLGTPLPTGLVDRLAAARESEPTAVYLEPGRAWKDELLSNVRELKSWQARLGLLREVALPAPGYMLRAYGLRGRFAALLLPFLYAHRSVRGIWKVMTGRK
jgi:hypothetical protein